MLLKTITLSAPFYPSLLEQTVLFFHKGCETKILFFPWNCTNMLWENKQSCVLVKPCTTMVFEKTCPCCSSFMHIGQQRGRFSFLSSLLLILKVSLAYLPSTKISSKSFGVVGCSPMIYNNCYSKWNYDYCINRFYTMISLVKVYQYNIVRKEILLLLLLLTSYTQPELHFACM